MVRDFVEYFGKPFRLTDICEHVDIARSTAEAYIKELVREGVVHRVAPSVFVRHDSSNLESRHVRRRLQYHNGDIWKTIETARQSRDKLVRQIEIMQETAMNLDRFITDMEGVYGVRSDYV
jgi:predicted transcriptional regulator